MPNHHPTPRNTTEFVRALHASLDEDALRLREASDDEVDAEMLERGIQPGAALKRLHSLLEQRRRENPGGALSSLEALYQRCRVSMAGVAGPIRDDVLGMISRLSPEHVGRATTYAASIDPQNHESLERFRQDLSGLQDEASPDKS